MSSIQIVKKDNYDQILENHKNHMESNEDYKRAVESLSFIPGRKLELVIEVTDEYLSSNIMSLLHQKLPGQELLGFKVNEVVLFPEERINRLVKEKLQRMTNQIDMNPQT
jgi:hypothetical protein